MSVVNRLSTTAAIAVVLSAGAFFVSVNRQLQSDITAAPSAKPVIHEITGVPPVSPQLPTSLTAKRETQVQHPANATLVTNKLSLLGIVLGDCRLALVRNNSTNCERFFKYNESVFGEGRLTAIRNDSIVILANGERIGLSLQSRSSGNQTADAVLTTPAIKNVRPADQEYPVPPPVATPLPDQQIQPGTSQEEISARVAAIAKKAMADKLAGR